jgi:hypothetical protein
MFAIAHRPLLVVSLAVTSAALIGFLWQRRRKEEYEENCTVFEPPEFVFSDATAREVSVKLENLKRSRLENIEEEEKVLEEERPPSTTESGHGLDNSQDAESEEEKTSKHNDLTSEEVLIVNDFATEIEPNPATQILSEGQETAISLESSILETVTSTEIELTDIKMTEKEAEAANQEQVPDIQAALKVWVFLSQGISG